MSQVVTVMRSQPVPFFLVAACVLCMPGSALAERRHVPAGKWAIEYQADTCTLSREGLDGQPGIAIRTRPLDESHDLMLFMPFAGQQDRSFKGWVQLGAAAPESERWILIERSPGRTQAIVETSLSASELARMTAAGEIGLTGPEGFEVRASLPPMGKPLAALEECEVYLAARWGITAGEMKAWARPARALEDLRNLFWSTDRSAVVMLRSSDGIRGVLGINEKGIMTDCKMVQRSAVAWVNSKFCETIRQRAKFEPARNAAGQPVRGKVITPEIRSARLR